MQKRKTPTPLRAIRRSRDLTQADVALATGIHPTRISVYENAYEVPSKAQQAKLAKFFRVPVTDLFEAAS